MSRTGILFATGAAMLLAACTTVPGAAGTTVKSGSALPPPEASASAAAATPPAPAVAAKVIDEAPEIGKLGQLGLPPERCGMLLWTTENQRPALVFRSIAGEGADMIINGAPAHFAFETGEGDARYGVASVQRFRADASDVVVDVSAEFGLDFDNGAYVERGRLVVRGANGWERIAPVAGLVGCRGAV